MVVYHHSVHHVGLVVPFIDAENVSLDTIIERSGRDLDLFLSLSDVVPKRIDLVVCDRDEIVGNEECAYADHSTYKPQRNKYALKRNAGRLYGKELVVLSQCSQCHH